MSPAAVAVGTKTTASWGTDVRNSIIDIEGSANVTLKFTPGGTLSTPTSGTATWITLGNVTVPTWATQAVVTWSLYGVLSSATEPTVSMQLKIGTVGGDTPRIMGNATAVGRSHPTISETITGLSTGSQSVTIFCTYTAGANTFAVDANSRIMARFTFKP